MGEMKAWGNKSQGKIPGEPPNPKESMTGREIRQANHEFGNGAEASLGQISRETLIWTIRKK